ncbi:MAG: hypothetical protein H7A41_00015 [Chlamydiales bacterium]|nr:hypothetical protein [Chlamydiales bacterium]
MTPVDGESSAVAFEAYHDQSDKLPFNMARDLYDLQVAFAQMKKNPDFVYDQLFRQKMVDYLNNYVNDYNDDVKNGKLTADQQIAFSDLNEDLNVAGLIVAPNDRPLSQPNDITSIQPYLEHLAKNDDKVTWIDVINDAINSIL